MTPLYHENHESTNTLTGSADQEVTGFVANDFWMDQSRRHVELVLMEDPIRSLPEDFENALIGFEEGIDEVRPEPNVVESARIALILTARFGSSYSAIVDDDGELYLDLRSAKGRLVVVEFCVDGRIQVGVHDEDDKVESHLTITSYERLVPIIVGL